jgi:exo-beta-1,3-glucanase (GH17 family)
MRTSLAALALAAVPSVLALQKGKQGFALGTKKPDGTCKYTADYEADFDAIKAASGSTIVRGYSASDCNCAQQILPAAESKGFQVMVAVWPDVEDSLKADVEALKTYATKYKDQVYAVSVGSETMYRRNFTGEQLLEKIMDVKDALGGAFRMATADSWNRWADGTGDAVIRGGIDIILANGFSYWQGAAAGEEAKKTYLDDMQQALGHIQEVSGSLDAIEFWNGESGWPGDGGSDYGEAKAGTKNAETFYHQGYCAALDWGLNAFYFEAFDEYVSPSLVNRQQC